MEWRQLAINIIALTTPVGWSLDHSIGILSARNRLIRIHLAAASSLYSITLLSIRSARCSPHATRHRAPCRPGLLFMFLLAYLRIRIICIPRIASPRIYCIRFRLHTSQFNTTLPYFLPPSLGNHQSCAMDSPTASRFALALRSKHANYAPPRVPVSVQIPSHHGGWARMIRCGVARAFKILREMHRLI